MWLNWWRSWSEGNHLGDVKPEGAGVLGGVGSTGGRLWFRGSSWR